MDEAYRIEVLHIVNPHVMFVESQVQKGVPVIEQVGIYGVLPVNKTIDIDGEVVSERCENWPVAANNILREFLADHKNCIYFVPLQVDERSSIFDDSTYQFGDIIVKAGKKISITSFLVQFAVAVKDEPVFHQKLSSGSLKIKLNSIRTEQVINEIKKYYQKQKKVEHDWQKTINKQTTLFQESKKISSELTKKNLRLFERNSEYMGSVMETIEKKEKDLDLCKDADLVSVGRGSRRKRVSHPNLTAQLEDLLSKEDKEEYKPHDVLNNVKKFLETHGRTKDTPSYENFKHKSKDHGIKRSTPVKDDNEKSNIQKDEHKYYNDLQESPSQIYSQGQEQEISSKKSDNQGCQYDRQRMNSALQHQQTIKRGMSSLKPKERLVVYCPDMEMSTENLKSLVPKKIDDYIDSKPTLPTEIKEIDKSSFNDDDLVDSFIDIETAKVGGLKKLASRHGSYDRTSTKEKKSEVINTPENNETRPQISHSQTTEAKNVGNTQNKLVSTILRKKLQALKDLQERHANNSASSISDTSVKDTSLSSTEQPEISKSEPKQLEVPHVQPKFAENVHKVERNVNPFKNLDGSKSVFVEKLVGPVLMVHTKNDNLILPECDLRSIPFQKDIHCVLSNMHVKVPKRLQTVSWRYILRGHSLFMVAPSGHGKTLGYVPAVCNLVTDSIAEIESVGPLCVIVCATALSVAEVETYCKKFLGVKERIVVCFPGVDRAKVTTNLLNGCHVLICTAPSLVDLLEVDFGVDLRRLLVLVFDDCERLSQVYTSELNKILHHVKGMLKKRADKWLKVQYVVVSREWCDFMTPLAKKAPDTVIAIGASHECVLYSKTKTSVNFVKTQTNKVKVVIEFLKEIDTTKRTVIVCREDDEVDSLNSTLTTLKHTVFACNSNMTLHDLYKLNEDWGNYQEPVLGPILVCCDGNLAHLNITNANYLVHFSMPSLFSVFCKRFSVLNENYASIFGPENDNVKIKILLDETNVEQLPKILHFVQRCTKEAYPILDNVLQEVLEDKDLKKAENLIPICNILLMLGECIDMWNCSDRHTGFKEFDEPEDWIPKQGVVTFKIMHYDSAVTYSARLLSKVTKSGVTKYPNNNNTLSLKMGMYYSKEINRKSHGKPKVGDICAVSIKQNFFERCKVMRVIPTGGSDHILINRIDEEQLTITKDVQLYYLPDDLKAIETHVVKIRLANIQPRDKDVTFSVAAKTHLQKMTERDRDTLYMRGQVVMTLGNCIFVDTLEACTDLSSLGETVVSYDFKKELLGQHAEPNPRHIEMLKKLGGIVSSVDKSEPEVALKVQKSPKWAHLDKDDLSTVFCATVVDAGTLFVRLAKFEKLVGLLNKDIKEYVEKTPELEQEEIYVGNVVLAEYPDDKTYERARIDAIVGDKQVKCFFVDNGDWRQVSVSKLRSITDKILDRIPFQAIECRLIGVKPPGDANDWPEFSTCWLYDNCFDDSEGNAKYLYVNYFTKEEATVTGGHKYGVVLFDTNSDRDVVINKMLIDLNLAKENQDESKYIGEPLNIKPVKVSDSSSDEEDGTGLNNSSPGKVTPMVKDLVPLQSKEKYDNKEINYMRKNILFDKPIRSVPLVNDSDSDISDKWDVNVDKDLLGMFGKASQSNVTDYTSNKNTTEEEKNMSPVKTVDKSESGTVINEDIDISNNKTIETISSGSCSSSIVETKENIKGEQDTIPKSPTLESQTDSDDIDIGNERIEALNILKSKLNTNETIEKTMNKAALVKSEIHKNYDRKDTVDKISKINIKVDKQNKNLTLDSDDLSSAASESQNLETVNIVIPKIEPVDPPRKPKLVWRQNKNSITMKINLIGVEDYDLETKERYLKFNTWHNDTTYEFDFVLYGVIKPEKSVHSNKGQYIQVSLVKLLKRNWLNLTKDCSAKKWIVYDVDAIDFTSDEDEDQNNNDALKAIKHNHEKVDSASEDEDFADDMNFRYKKH